MCGDARAVKIMIHIMGDVQGFRSNLSYIFNNGIPDVSELIAMHSTQLRCLPLHHLQRICTYSQPLQQGEHLDISLSIPLFEAPAGYI